MWKVFGEVGRLEKLKLGCRCVIVGRVVGFRKREGGRSGWGGEREDYGEGVE